MNGFILEEGKVAGVPLHQPVGGGIILRQAALALGQVLVDVVHGCFVRPEKAETCLAKDCANLSKVNSGAGSAYSPFRPVLDPEVRKAAQS